jgi:hypothetical protein
MSVSTATILSHAPLLVNVGCLCCTGYWAAEPTIKWLREQGCHWDAFEVCKKAVVAITTAILAYVLGNSGRSVNARRRLELLNAAGFYGSLAAAVLLREHGAEWPVKLSYRYMNWKPALHEWARQQGCTSRHAADPVVFSSSSSQAR